MNGKSKIYSDFGNVIKCDVDEAIGIEAELTEKKRLKDITFYGEDIIKANLLFRLLVLKPDTKMGIKMYENKIKKIKEKNHE